VLKKPDLRITKKREEGAPVSALVVKIERAVTLFDFFFSTMLRHQNSRLPEYSFSSNSPQDSSNQAFLVRWINEDEVKILSSTSQQM